MEAFDEHFNYMSALFLAHTKKYLVRSNTKKKTLSLNLIIFSKDA